MAHRRGHCHRHRLLGDAWLYRRSTKEVAFVRTGFLGEKVVIDGGAFVWPIVHDITPVNMNTLALQVARNKAEALITRDRMRVDVEAEFYVRVRPTPGRSPSPPRPWAAAPSRQRTSTSCSPASSRAPCAPSPPRCDGRDARAARRLCRPRLGDGEEDLTRNGLELEFVAILDIDQTGLEYFNPSNRFDAEGLTSLIKDIEERRKLRNDIEQDSIIRIRARNLEAEKEALAIERESEEARLMQERDIEFRRAQQRAELTRERAERETEAESAQITANEAIARARITNERMIAESRITSEREIRQLEIERQSD